MCEYLSGGVCVYVFASKLGSVPTTGVTTTNNNSSIRSQQQHLQWQTFWRASKATNKNQANTWKIKRKDKKIRGKYKDRYSKYWKADKRATFLFPVQK